MLCLTLQVTWYAELLISLVGNPDTLKRTDFVIFYLSGKISNEVGPSQIYNADLQYQMRQELTGFDFNKEGVLPFNHPPIMLPLMRLIVFPDITLSFLWWTANSLALIALSAMFIYRILRAHNIQTQYRWQALAGMVLFYPLFIAVLKGQDSTLLLFGLALWFYGLERKNDTLAGLGLSLSVIRPQIAIILAVPFLFKQQKVFWWFVIGSAFLVLYSIGLIGLFGAQSYIKVILDTAQNTVGAGQSAMFNLLGAILRIFPTVSLPSIRFIVWGTFALAILSLSIMWWNKPEIGLPQGAIAILLALLAAPHLHYHDLAVMLLPLVVAGIIFVEMRKAPQFVIGSLIIGLSTFFLISDVVDSFRYIPTYVTVFYILCFLLSHENIL